MNKQLRIVTNSADETRNAACRLAAYLKPGDVLLLFGEMGSGKTTFTQGLALGLGIEEYVSSPTYGLISQYSGSHCEVIHMDLCRLETTMQAEQAGAGEYMCTNTICIIEWPEVLGWMTPENVIKIAFYHKSDDQRSLDFTFDGPDMISREFNV